MEESGASAGACSGARGLPAPLFGLVNLAGGLTGGLVSVTLVYELGRRGVSTLDIAGLVNLFLLPSALTFLIGPAIDLTLGARAWSVLSIVVLAAVSVALGLAPLSKAALPVLGAEAFAAGVGGYTLFTALSAAMAASVPDEKRGAVAAWMTAGFWGGSGLGGGVWLGMTTHAGGFAVAAWSCAALDLLCGLPLLYVRTPPPMSSAGWRAPLRDIGRALASLISSRAGVLTVLAVTLPVSIGAALRLLPAVADDWRVNADMVAAASGAAAGLAILGGCVVGGHMADHVQRRPFFVLAGLLFAATEAGLAFAPHTPLMFAVFVPANLLALGVGYAAVNTVIFELLGEAAGTVSSVLASLSNVPMVAMTAFVGAMAQAHGPTAMLSSEAVIGAVAALAFAALAWLWRPGAHSLRPTVA